MDVDTVTNAGRYDMIITLRNMKWWKRNRFIKNYKNISGCQILELNIKKVT